MEKRKVRTRTYKEKVEILTYIEEHPGAKKKDIAQIFTMSTKTLSDVIKAKKKSCKLWHLVPLPMQKN